MPAGRKENEDQTPEERIRARAGLRVVPPVPKVEHPTTSERSAGPEDYWGRAGFGQF
jgi:hypothetical protein